MKLGIICAMSEEIRLIKEDISITKISTIANREFCEGTLYGKEVVLVMSRIGKVAAAITATVLIETFGVDAVVFSGTAGGVDPNMNVGDAVVADCSVQHDFDCGNPEPFEVPIIKKSYFETDKELNKKAIIAVEEYISTQMLKDIPQEYLDKFKITAPKLAVGAVASGDQFICTHEKNRWLYDNVKNCKCVEMEGAAVGQVCYEYEIPHAIIRIVSDCANDDASVDFDLFIQKAAAYFTRGTIRAFVQKF